MDDQGLVGILHREQTARKQPQAFADRQSVSIAIFVDTNALDVLHDEIGQSLFSAPTIKQPYDAGWSRAARVCRSLRKRRRISSLFVPGSNILMATSLRILVIRPLGQIDDRHAPMPNLVEDAVRTNPFSRHRTRRRGQQIRGGTILEKVGELSKLDSSDSISVRRESSAPQAWRKKLLRSPGSRSRAKVNNSFTGPTFQASFCSPLRSSRASHAFAKVPITLESRPETPRLRPPPSTL